MARVTVEDCIDKVENRFELVLLAGHRTRQISNGSAITVDRDNDKNPVVSLREIAEETLSPGDLKEDLVHSLQKHVEIDEPEANISDEEAGAISLPDRQDPVFSNAPDKPEGETKFNRMSEDELLRGIEGLVAPDKSDDF